MNRKEAEDLDATIDALENDEDDTIREEELEIIIDRLCDMSDKDYFKFTRYIKYERKARKQLGDMSQYAWTIYLHQQEGI